MKRIIFILFVLMSFCAVNAQTTYPTFLPSPKGDSALAQYGYVWPKTLLLLPNRDTAIRPKYPSLVYWPRVGVDSTLWIYDMYHWKQVTGSGSGGTVVWGDITGDIHNQTDLINYIDSVVNASSGSIEYVTQGYGIKVDSALRVYMVRADTAVLASKTWFYNRIDSLILTFNNTYVKYSDTASMLSHYVRRVLAGTNTTVDNTNPQYPIVSATAGGSGTVTSFSSGNLSPLFTTSVATATTTPALSYSLSTATAWRVFSTNASTTPAYNQLKAEHLNTTYSNGNMLITDGSGNLSWTSAGGSGTVTSVAASAASGMTVTGSPITGSGTLAFAWTGAVQGDLPYFSAANTVSFLNKSASANQFLKNSGTSNNPAWSSIAASDITSGAALTKVDDTNVTLTLGGSPSTSLLAATSLTLGWSGTLGPTRGGTGTGTYATGDMLYASGTNTLSKLAIGSAGQHLVVSGGVPIWRDTAAAGGAGWSLTGNAGTTAASNFIGTTDAVSFRTRTNNTERVIVDSAGFVGINTSVPTTYLVVTGDSSYPTLGSELINTANYTSTNWTTVVAGTYTHNTGNTTALTNTLAGVVSTAYRIGWKVTGRTAGTFTIAFAGRSISAQTGTGEAGIIGSTTGTLSVTPTSTFDGTVTLTIKTITGNSNPIAILKNATGSSMEFRSDTSTNIGIGPSALARNVTGSDLTTNFTGSQNTAIGYNSLAVNVSGDFNTAIGASALAVNTSGYGNTAIGKDALKAITVGAMNVAIGTGAGAALTTGSNNADNGGNTAIGYGTLASATTSTGNVAIGWKAMTGNSSLGGACIAIGSGAMLNTSSSSTVRDIAIGSTSQSVVSLGDNVTIGHGNIDGQNTSLSGYSNAVARNTIIGSQSANSFSGTDGTMIGYRVNYNGVLNNSTIRAFKGTFNVVIGSLVSQPDTVASNQLAIGGNSIRWAISDLTGGSSTRRWVLNGTAADIAATTASAALDIQSTTGGIKIPTQTGTQRDAISSPATGLQVYNSDNRAVSQYNGINWTNDMVVSAAGTLTLKQGNDYVFTGTTTTWTLPAIDANVLGRQNRIYIKNRGSGAITLNTATGNTLYNTAATNTITINAGAACELLPDGTYNLVLYNL